MSSEHADSLQCPVNAFKFEFYVARVEADHDVLLRVGHAIFVAIRAAPSRDRVDNLRCLEAFHVLY